jgi:hypothetical protein
VGLQLNRPLWRHGAFAIKIILHNRIFDYQLFIEPDGCTAADLDDTKTIPLAKGLVGKRDRIHAWSPGAVVPQPARTFVRANVELRFLREIPNLHLGDSLQVDAAVSLGHFTL